MKSSGILLLLSLVWAVFNVNKNPETEEMLLEYKVRLPKVNVENPPLLILLHGVGSNEESMHQLAPYIDDHFLVISARGPIQQGQGSYRWYAVDFSTGKPVINAKEAEESRLQIIDFIGQLKQKHHFDEQQVFLGGFSQGGIMSYSVGLSEAKQFKGVISLSGRMLKENIANIKHYAVKETSFLIIHGKADRVLPIQYAREANQLLRQEGAEVSFHELEIDHGINNQTIQFLNQWLAAKRAK